MNNAMYEPVKLCLTSREWTGTLILGVNILKGGLHESGDWELKITSQPCRSQ